MKVHLLPPEMFNFTHLECWRGIVSLEPEEVDMSGSWRAESSPELEQCLSANEATEW